MHAKSLFRFLVPAYAVAMCILPVGAAVAEAPQAGSPAGIQLGTFGGTTGFGFEGAFRVNRFCHLRAGRSTLDFGLGSTYRGIPYRYDSDITWTSAVLDLYPGDGGFRFTAGVYASDASVEVTAVTDDPLDIGSRTYSPEQLGEIHGKVDMLPAAPYLGVGFDNRPSAEAGLHMSMELGVIFQDYSVDLWHEGGSLPPELEQQLSQDVETEQSFLQEQFDIVDVYPVVSMSLSCRF